MPQLIPPVLFKYFPPERLDVLTQGRVRISQRQVVNDERDFRPNYLQPAPPEVLAEALTKQVERDSAVPERLRPTLVRHMVENFGTEMRDLMLARIRTPDEIGMLCLTDNPNNEEMWHEYASRGFVIAFDVAKLAGTTFPKLWIRKLSYTDEPIKYITDGIPNLEAFYRKEIRWSGESEWRGTHRLARFEVIGLDNRGFPIHVCPVPPAAVLAVLIRNDCTVEKELGHIIALDCRYRHVRLESIE